MIDGDVVDDELLVAEDDVPIPGLGELPDIEDRVAWRDVAAGGVL